MAEPAPRPPISPAPPAASRRVRTAIALGLALVTAAVFGPALAGGFVTLDDDAYVTANRHVLGGLSLRGLAWAATSFDAANWHPLTWLSHMLDVELFGLDPAGHHATSVLLHALNAGLAFLALRALTGASAPSALAAALFALHPLRVESVAWVAERKDVLSGTCFLALLLAYARYVRAGGRPAAARGPYAATIALFALGLAAKPMLVTAPFVLLLLDAWPLRRWRSAGARRLVLEKLPHLGLAVVSVVLTARAQAAGGAISSFEVLPFPLRAANAFAALGAYLRSSVLPTGLACLYPLPPARPALGAAFVAASPGLVLFAAFGALALARARAWPWLAVGWAWFLGMLVPVLGLVQVGSATHADRYTYLPSIGLAVAVAWGAWTFARGRRGRELALGAAAVLALGASAWAARRQVATWRDSVALFEHAVRVVPGNYAAEQALANALVREGRPGEALPHFERALAIHPDHHLSLSGYGDALVRVGRVSEALAPLERCVRVRPGYPEGRNNLGMVLGRLGRLEPAVEQLEAAARLAPDVPQIRCNLGSAYALLGRDADARREFEAALALDPASQQARSGLEALWRGQGGGG